MPPPTWFAPAVYAFGCVVALAFVARAVVHVRSAKTSEQRREAYGAAVPGLAGPLLAAAVFVAHPIASITLVVVALVVLVVGRALYELVAFRRPRSR